MKVGGISSPSPRSSLKLTKKSSGILTRHCPSLPKRSIGNKIRRYQGAPHQLQFSGRSSGYIRPRSWRSYGLLTTSSPNIRCVFDRSTFLFQVVFAHQAIQPALSARNPGRDYPHQLHGHNAWAGRSSASRDILLLHSLTEQTNPKLQEARRSLV